MSNIDNEGALDDQIPAGKVYKDRALWFGTFLGGPLVAAYFFAENYKTLGLRHKVMSTWIIGIISTIALFSLVFMIPDNVYIPNQLIPVIYTLIVYGIFKMYQEDLVNAHLNAKGLAYGWGRIVFASISGAIITVIPVVLIAISLSPVNPVNLVSKNYGTIVSNEISYEKANISEREVDQIANAFEETGFFDETVPKFVYVHKNRSTYEISISMAEGFQNDPFTVSAFKSLRSDMGRYLRGKKVIFKMIVDYLDNVVMEIE